MRCCSGKRVWTGLGVLVAGLLVVDPHAVEGDRAAEIARLRREIQQLKAQASDVSLAAAGEDRAAGAPSAIRRADRQRAEGPSPADEPARAHRLIRCCYSGSW